jgi:hypothetical protein
VMSAMLVRSLKIQNFSIISPRDFVMAVGV